MKKVGLKYIDQVFKGYGEEHFGKEIMAILSDDEIEEAHCAAFCVISDLLDEGYEKKLNDDSLKNAFFEYITLCLRYSYGVEVV